MGYIGNASIQEAQTNPMRKSRNPLGATKIRALRWPLAVGRWPLRWSQQLV